MSQPIGRPASGARYIAERIESEGGEGTVVYRGLVRLPDADLPLEVTITLPSGATRAVVEGGTPEHVKTAAALVRAATKSAVASGEDLPRKVERWRG
jgi:hypothetical protein